MKHSWRCRIEQELWICRQCGMKHTTESGSQLSTICFQVYQSPGQSPNIVDDCLADGKWELLLASG